MALHAAARIDEVTFNYGRNECQYLMPSVSLKMGMANNNFSPVIKFGEKKTNKHKCLSRPKPNKQMNYSAKCVR